MNRLLKFAFALVLAAAAAPAMAQSYGMSASEVRGITQPSERRRLAFPQAGLVEQMLVKEGVVVKSGEVLGKQMDYLERKELERLELEATATSRIEAAKADLDHKKAVLKRKESIFSQGGGNESEVQEAALEVLVAEKRLKLAEDEQAQAKIKAEQQKKKVDLTELRSTIDGIVESVNVGAGELTDIGRQDGAVVVVKNNPLYVEVRDLKTSQVAKLKKGDKLQIKYENEAGDRWQEAEVFYIAPVALAVDAQLVKLTLPNPQGRSAGMGVVVKLPPEIAGAATEDRTARLNP